MTDLIVVLHAGEAIDGPAAVVVLIALALFVMITAAVVSNLQQ